MINYYQKKNLRNCLLMIVGVGVKYFSCFIDSSKEAKQKYVLSAHTYLIGACNHNHIIKITEIIKEY